MIHRVIAKDRDAFLILIGVLITVFCGNFWTLWVQEMYLFFRGS
ncbi:hypothetical protein LEP1GSC115_3979 [Leptospira interrogans serovar Australis str. 200703203]|uniref:Uncharacterized protein n=1 Tax=Leptospira interrogans serovar Australis str. 200703203 TaxID=1085541 RepID=N1UJP2_LEPIR|nr:hypothetical protein LEP1GSC115_3979 [Leptospira interrogans serovar Australis str. 200703203]